MTERCVFEGGFEVPESVANLLGEVLPRLEPVIDKKFLPLSVLTREVAEVTEVLLREPANGKIIIAPLIEEALTILPHGIVVADSWSNADKNNLEKLAGFLRKASEGFRVWFYGEVEAPIDERCQQNWAGLLGKGLGLSDVSISTGDLNGLIFYCMSGSKGKFSQPDPNYLIIS